ncbi:hypothetical protein CY35_17G068900 [Sphagnum magellanicum]|nr:hypothetical protein CY35_17G068900 [Sphagnum magellanicum]KAH9535737.1 hypothetical protein CY35_17G068900 [Sphagnum magellanicum]
MVKFSKQLDMQLVPEWRGAYCQYKLLKKDLKLITFNWHLMPECPVAPSNPPFALTRRKSPWSSVDVIKVHCQQPENTDLPVYHTELLAPVAPAAYLKRFFSRLDAELNKVNTFYKTKEEEFLQRGLLLDKQMFALIEVKNLLKHDHSHSSAGQSDDNSDRRRNSSMNLLVSMESGCLEKNQLLLDSIVEASCNGGSALPDLNLDEDTVQGRELNDTGLKEGIIPVGALKRASMNKNLQTLEESSTMHLMKEIQELPVSTDPKDSVTQSAMLCAPSTMRSYRNEAGGNAETRKDQKGSHVRLNIPHVSPTATLSALSQMLWEDVLRQAKKSATLYGGKVDIVLSQRKVQRAENMLRAAFIEFYRGLGFLKNYSSLNMVACAKILKKYDKITGMLVSGKYMYHVENSYMGASQKIVELMDKVEAIFTEHFAQENRRHAMSALRPMQQKASHTVTYLFGLFSGCSLALLTSFGILLKVAGDYNTATKDNYLRSIFPTFGMLALIVLHIFMYGWNVYSWRLKGINYAFIFEFSPGSELRYREVFLVCTCLTTVVSGAMVMHLSMLSTLLKWQSHYVDLFPFMIILVVLVDFFLADQLTSQCVRRCIDEEDYTHLANGAKYLSAMTAVALKIAYGRQKSRASLALFVIASTIATAYQLYWDLVIDWGLLVRKSANPWLRDQLILDRKWIYFLSMVLNAILRLAWLQSLTQFQIGSPQMDTYITDFVFACLEIIRRGHWNFYRLENEHLNNVGHYRAIKTVPLPFEELNPMA